jgi:hypothetical protein
MKINYPIAIDNEYAMWRALKNEYWPTLYFVDGRGRIRHHHFGEGEYAKSEMIIQQLLSEAGIVGIDHKLVSLDARGVEAAARWVRLLSRSDALGSNLIPACRITVMPRRSVYSQQLVDISAAIGMSIR